jgi:hypothetical protein
MPRANGVCWRSATGQDEERLRLATSSNRVSTVHPRLGPNRLGPCQGPALLPVSRPGGDRPTIRSASPSVNDIHLSPICLAIVNPKLVLAAKLAESKRAHLLLLLGRLPLPHSSSALASPGDKEVGRPAVRPPSTRHPPHPSQPISVRRRGL